MLIVGIDEPVYETNWPRLAFFAPRLSQAMDFAIRYHALAAPLAAIDLKEQCCAG
jgi:hypothetical protein